MSTLGNESRAGSNRPSLTPGAATGDTGDPQPTSGEGKGNFQLHDSSFLDAQVLKQLQRQLDQEVVDSEMDVKVKSKKKKASDYAFGA